MKQADALMLDVIRVMEDVREVEIVTKLLRFRDAIQNQDSYEELSTEAEAARAELINIVNNFFFERLSSVPEINNYIEMMQNEADQHIK